MRADFPVYKVVKVADLVPYACNSRTHSDEQVAQIALSIKEFGFTNPVLIDGDNGMIAGHGRILGAQLLGMTEVPAIELSHLSEAQRKAYIIADNQLALNAGWDLDVLRSEGEDLLARDFDLDLLGFDSDFLDGLLADEEVPPSEPENITPEAPAAPVTVLGDVWLLGKHRVMCGDSTSVDAVAVLMAGEKAACLHADPPYGMGKESEGVTNDNLRGNKLDDFQMEWWSTYRSYLEQNASVYIWGNAPELWRLWYVRLAGTEVLTLRNEIVWDKGSVSGMRSRGLTQYPVATERCLFFQIGSQYLGSVNSDAFPSQWEPLRQYLAAEAEVAGLRPRDVKSVCGCGMFSHWFTKSQFTLIPEKHYSALAAAYPGRFTRPWADLKAEWSRVGRGPQTEFESQRSFFDNTHDIMRDVWSFPRVVGGDRHGHATPKPEAMMSRVARSSVPPDGLMVEPFGGTGSTLIGADKSGRRCYVMELTPSYVDVIVKRWQNLTGGGCRPGVHGRDVRRSGRAAHRVA